MHNKGKFAYFIYDLVWCLLGLLVAPIVILKVLFFSQDRRSFFARLGWFRYESKLAKPLLLHGVSVGEITALKPLVAAIQERYPELPLVVSSTTSSGRMTAKRLFPGIEVVCFPLDFPFAVSNFYKRVNPCSVVLAELEIWPNFLRKAGKLGIPIGIVNGRITEGSLAGYRRVQRLLLPKFDGIAVYGVQNEEYANRFLELSVPAERIHVTGNLKYENLPNPNQAPNPEWSGYLGEHKVVTLASTHADEELQLCRHFMGADSFGDVVVVIVPRHPRRCATLFPKLKEVLGTRPLHLRSSLAPGSEIQAGSFILVDSFGELEDIYRLSNSVFVGGSLIPHGGQNMVEAVALQCPVVMGPHYTNFVDEVALLKAAGCLNTSSNVVTLLGYLGHWIEYPDLAKIAGQKGLAALADGKGATTKTLAILADSKIIPA